jgi:TIR domain
MSQIFISHVEEDAQIALDIAQGLEAAGYRTWYYERDSDPGPSYLLQIDRALLDSQVVVLIISPQSIRSHQVTKEVVLAHESGKAFLPVLCGLSHAEFQEQQPEWRVALGAAASIPVPSQGVSGVLPRILRGIEKLTRLQESQPLAPMSKESEQHGLEASRDAGESAVADLIGRRSPWRSKVKVAAVGLMGILVLTVVGYLIKSRIDQERLESRLAQVTEFSDFFLMGTAYWSAPPTWKASKGQLDVAGPGIGFIKNRIFGDFKASFDLQLLNRKGAVWIVRAKDERNYYHFQLLGPGGSSPNAFITSLCKNGKLTPLMTFPVNQDLSQADEWCHIIIEARGSKISHQIQISSQPGREPPKMAFLEDQTFSYGGIGFGTKDGEEFRLGSITVVPVTHSLSTGSTRDTAGK